MRPSALMFAAAAFVPMTAAAATSTHAQLAAAADSAVAKGVPSLVIVLFDRQHILWSHVAGYADVAAKRRPTLNTRYRVGSMAKAMTSTVLALAAARGEFSFGTPVTVRTTSGSATITANQAVNMEGGLAQAVCYQGITGDPDALCGGTFGRQFAVAMSDGSGRYAYSNMGPQIAADALATSMRQPFAAIARDLLFRRLGMNESSYDHAQPRSDRAVSYDGMGKPYDHEFAILPAAGAGLETSADDLVRFGQVHLGGGSLLSSRSLEMLHSAPNGGFYGYGWGRIGAGKPTEVLICDGQVNGGQAMLILSPHNGVGAIVMANAARDEVSDLAVKAIDELAPGTAAAFAADVSTMQSAHEANVARFLPPRRFEGQGFVRAGEHHLTLSARADENRLIVTIDGQTSEQSQSSIDEGLRGWTVPCAAALPACARPGATAKLWLSKDRGGLGGQLQVTGFNGQLPYPVRLRLH